MTDDGIVLQVRTHRENDQLITFYFRRHGKMTVIARGAKRSKKRFVGLIATFNHLSCELKKNRKTSIFELQEASLINSNMTYAKSYEAIIYGAYLLDLVMSFSQDQHSNSKLFDTIKDTISALTINNDPESLIRKFEWEILTITGYKPELGYCIKCRKQRGLNQNVLFFTKDGGIICRDCRPHLKIGYLISSHTINILLNNEEINDEKSKSELRKIFPEFIVYQLGRNLPSLAVLEEMSHFAKSTQLQKRESQPETMEQ